LLIGVHLSFDSSTLMKKPNAFSPSSVERNSKTRIESTN
jgi:hypothetical protein